MPRVLDVGDEAVARAACARFLGLHGDVDVGAFLDRRETTVIVVEDAGGVVGWVYGHELVHPGGERTMLLYAVDVAEFARGQGCGLALVKAFVSDADQRGCTEVWVLTDHDNDAAIATYSSAGAKVDGAAQLMFTWQLATRRSREA